MQVDNNYYLPTKMYFLLHEIGLLKQIDRLLMPSYSGFDHARTISDAGSLVKDVSQERDAFNKQWNDKFGRRYRH